MGEVMNVLEKILEATEKESKLAHEEMRRCASEKHLQFDEIKGYARACETILEIIRSYMDEVTNMSVKRLIDANALDDEVMNFFIAITGNPKQTTVVRECKESFRRIIDEQPTIYADDGWIPVSERLPEEHDSIFAKIKDTDKWREAMFEKISDEVNVTIKYEDGSRKTTTSYTLDGVWEIEKEQRIVKQKVIAWQPLPEPYKGGE